MEYDFRERSSLAPDAPSQISGVSTATQMSAADHSVVIPTKTNDQGTPESLPGQQQQQQQQPANTLTSATKANLGETSRAVPTGPGSSRETRKKGREIGGLAGIAALEDGFEQKAMTAGARLLQMTRLDVSRSPFDASREISRKFLRSLRVLRLHAFAAAAMKQCGAESQRQSRYGLGESRWAP